MLQAATIADNATAVSATGGTVITLQTAGITDGKQRAVVAEDTSLKTRRSADFAIKESKVNSQSPGGYTQTRNSVVLKFPRVLADGKLTIDTVKIEISRDISTTTADVKNMRCIAAQCLADTDMDSFYNYLQLS